MKKEFKIFCLLSLFLVLISFHAYADTEQESEQILRYGIGADILTFDLPNYRSSNDLMVGSLIFERLVENDQSMQNYIPALATSWERIDDLTWIFNLREGIKFTDGTPFNAEAVKISLERAAKSLKGQTYQGMISTVNILDDYKVEIKLKEPSAPFFSYLTMPTAAIFSPTAVEKYGDLLFQNPVGTGMFKLEEWIPGTHVVLTRNEDYWGTPVKLEKVIFIPIANEATRVMSFKAGELDVIENLPAHEVPAIEADPNSKLMIVPQLRTLWIGFNCSDPILKDAKVRQAIAHAIDRESIIKFTMEGLTREANLGALTPEIMKTDPPLSLDYDPELSKKLLAEAGYKDGLTLNLWTPEGRYAKDYEIAQVVQGQLQNVGINTNLSNVEWASYLDALDRLESQIFVLGWGLQKNPDAFFTACFHSEGEANWAGYYNTELDKMIDAAAILSDQEVIEKAYYEMNKLIIEEAVIFPIYYTTNLFAVKSGVEEFVVHPKELLNLSKTWIK